MRNRFLFVTLLLLLASSVASAQTLSTAKEYFDRANKRAEAGDQAGAIADYTKVIELAPGDYSAYSNRALAKKKSGDTTGAMADYNSSISIKPDYSYALRGRGNLREAQGDNVGAMADFNKVLAANPKDGFTYFDRGSLRNTLKDYPGAVSDFTNAILYNPSENESYYNRAIALKASGKVKEAIADYDKYISLNTDNTRYLADGYQNRGIAKTIIKDYAGAVADLTVAIKLFPEDAVLYTNRADAYRKMGKTALATADETKAASLKK
ncbi:MAG: tetratricopeptide repeat protein [Chloracidobacterium sp.]|nr:tetratricopeptide repeat protein [Chloracidobacterium sp.]